MWKIIIPFLSAIALCAAVFADPSEFWIDAPPNYVATVCVSIFFFLVLVFWIYTFVSNARDEKACAFTAYVNNELTDAQRVELTEPDPHYECNSGFLRCKASAQKSALAYIFKKNPPSYANL